MSKQILSIVITLLTLAQSLAKITPSPIDDEVIALLLMLINAINEKPELIAQINKVIGVKK